MTLKETGYYVGAVLLLFGGGYATGRYAAPAKVEERIVEKEVYVKQDNIDTTTTITKRPDGTQIVVTHEVDKSIETNTQEESVQVTVTAKSTITLLGGAGYNFRSPGIVYMVGIQKQVLGPVSIGVFGTTDGTAGVTAGVSF